MTFSFNRLGNLGHLGNQMFQYSVVKGLSKKHNRDFIIPPKSVFGVNYPELRSTIDECFNLNCTRSVTSFPIYFEKSFEFDEELFENPPSEGIDLLGYFQSEKYFKHIEDEIRKDFTFNEELLVQCSDFMLETFATEAISIHIRRTDYVVNPNHPVQPITYYLEALEEMPDHVPVVIFSDDPQWCKSQKQFSSDRFLVSENNTPDFDLCLMSLCNYHIIANSSFSWWGAWLANGKKVIAPKNWFGGDCINHNTKDLYLKDWVLI